MKKNFLKISAVILVSISLVGCGAKQSTENKQTEQQAATVEGPGKDFDWNAKVAPVGKKRTYTEQNTGKSFDHELTGLKRAQSKLSEKRKTITDKKVQEALKVVDAFYINQQNIDVVVKAAGFNNQKEMYKKLWEDYSKQLGVPDNETNFKFQDVNYNMKEYTAMYFKINSNAYGKAGAYDLEDYKVEGNTVYLSIKVPAVDTYQYVVQASNKSNYSSYLASLVNITSTSDNKFERMYAKTIFYLAAVDFRGDGYVDLQGMDYLAKEKQYLAIQVDDSGKVSIDNDKLLNLLRIKMDVANQKNMVKFNTTKI